MNQKIRALLVGIAIIIIGLSLVLAVLMPFSHREEKEIWLPQYYRIVNLKNGSYIAISEYRNDKAIEISFKDMLRIYETKLSNETFEIIVQQNGTIHYLWEYENISFIARQHNKLDYYVHYGSIVDVQEGKVTILYQADPIFGVLMTILIIALGVVSIVALWPTK